MFRQVFGKYPPPTKEPEYSFSKQAQFNDYRLRVDPIYPFDVREDKQITQFAVNEAWTKGQTNRFLRLVATGFDFSAITMKTADSMYERLDMVPITVSASHLSVYFEKSKKF